MQISQLSIPAIRYFMLTTLAFLQVAIRNLKYLTFGCEEGSSSPKQYMSFCLLWLIGVAICNQSSWSAVAFDNSPLKGSSFFHPYLIPCLSFSCATILLDSCCESSDVYLALLRPVNPDRCISKFVTWTKWLTISVSRIQLVNLPFHDRQPFIHGLQGRYQFIVRWPKPSTVLSTSRCLWHRNVGPALQHWSWYRHMCVYAAFRRLYTLLPTIRILPTAA